MSLVLDSSVALTWCFEDERTLATLALLDQITETGATAPALWPLEVLNALTMAERRGRLDGTQRHQLAGFLRDLPVSLDQETADQAWTITMRLAERYRLTLYDAAYLELAQRLELPLATLDQELRVAGNALGITLLGS
ncbi:putative nucleic acid-binding protein [Nitrosospira sp. Nsp5]|uniref:Predicted nucleic acid-binding protein, contains PIN domain n=1 Tax=Nitrosospira multiformis TaxID=1231 RepID=A0ABY0TAF5_9PROT|nr:MULTISPECIES: type II toxin-antitoxin system VapC family toxin [Nitrosospira]PTR08457.1 putative nucleic acid-binding protein [Nitrosospira sp. Nsp5]SDQ53367.1 Predicted nucleic acid-binding protein, contains PIN domain [Nitrosospira multiformis]